MVITNASEGIHFRRNHGKYLSTQINDAFKLDTSGKIIVDKNTPSMAGVPGLWKQACDTLAELDTVLEKAHQEGLKAHA